jgi:hypothetical protein
MGAVTPAIAGAEIVVAVATGEDTTGEDTTGVSSAAFALR